MNNPYSAPDARLSDSGFEDETYEPKIFSLNGRIGRLRYIGYSWLLMFVSAILIGILAAALMPIFGRGSSPGRPGAVIMIVFYVPIIAVSIIMAMRRLHDLDNSGWLSLLSLVPIVNIFFGLYLIFAAGTNGRNSYGPMPTKNSPLLWIVPLGIPIVGILAAISIPAYQGYVQRAKAARVQQLQQQAPQDQQAPAQQDQR